MSIYCRYGTFFFISRYCIIFYLLIPFNCLVFVSCSNNISTSNSKESGSKVIESSILKEIQSEQNKKEQQEKFWGDRLRKSGWSNKACNAVASVNFNNFSIMAEFNGGGVERMMQKLCILGSESALQSIIEERPEVAILFAEAVSKGISSEILVHIAHNLPQDLMNEIFMVHSHPDDFITLVQALEHNLPCIIKARQMGFDSPERLFMYKASSETRQIYHQWLRDIFDNKMPVYDEDQKAVFYAFLVKITYSTVNHMETNGAFRRCFMFEIWPDFLEACKNDPIQMQMYFEVEADDLWTVLRMEKGKDVLENWGAIGVDVITGTGYSDDLKDHLAEILADRSSFSEQTVTALMKFRDEPLFHQLLRRPLSGAAFAATCQRLLEAGETYPGRLEYYNNLSDSSLLSEMGSPPNIFQNNLPLYYTVWVIPKKTVEGREITIGDWTQSAIEVVFLPYDIYCLFFTGGTGNVASMPIKAGLKNTFKTAIKKSVDKVAQESLEKSIKATAKRTIGKELVQDISQERLSSFLGTAFVRETMKIARDRIKFNIVDLTSTLAVMSKVTNISKNTSHFMINSGSKLFKDGSGKTWWIKLTTQALKDQRQGITIDYFLNLKETQDVLLWAGEGMRELNENHSDEYEMKLKWEQNVADWYLNNALAQPF